MNLYIITQDIGLSEMIVHKIICTDIVTAIKESNKKLDIEMSNKFKNKTLNSEYLKNIFVEYNIDVILNKKTTIKENKDNGTISNETTSR